MAENVDVRLPHEGGADEDGLGATRLQSHDVGPGVDAALGDPANVTTLRSKPKSTSTQNTKPLSPTKLAVLPFKVLGASDNDFRKG